MHYTKVLYYKKSPCLTRVLGYRDLRKIRPTTQLISFRGGLVIGIECYSNAYILALRVVHQITFMFMK